MGMAQLEDGGGSRVEDEGERWGAVKANAQVDEIIVQFAGGPTFYAKHEVFTKPAESGGNGLGLAGPKDGLVELDNVTFWSVKPAAQPGWEAARAKLAKFTPVEAKAEPKKKAAKKK